MSVIPGQKAPDERRRILLASAIEEFAVHGYDGASTNRIAKKAQVAKGLIFRYFDSKEGLFEAALDQACERIFSPPGAPLPTDPFERLEEFLVRRATAIAEHPSEARLVAQFRGQARRVASPLTRRLNQAYERLRARFKVGADTRCFRPDVDHAVALELMALVAEGLEGQWLRFISAEMASSGATASSARPFAADGRIESGAASLPFVEPEAVRHRARAAIELLKKGIYRPGASARPLPVALDPGPFLALSTRLALSAVSIEDQRRERILRAAQELFAERGYDGASAEVIAERADVAKGLVFHHFGSKADLYMAAVADALDRLSEAFFADVGPPPFDLFQRLFDWMHHKLLIFQMQPTLSCLALSAFADPPASLRDRIREYMTEGTAEGWALILEGIDTAPFRPEIAPDQAVDLVMMVSDVVSDRGLARMVGEPGMGLDALPGIMAEARVCLELLRDGLCEETAGQAG